ncbi:MAG TPA: phosphonate degradation HD-domain oxygenase [Ramlibacter sp.]
MPLTIDQVVRLYASEGAARYGSEAVSQEQHALQCAFLAERAGATPQLVAAALLHDLGHLLEKREDAGAPRDDLHEFRALPFLRGEYPDSVIQPIRLHVAAKRYLCAVDPAYRGSLSAAARRSLDFQGGAFSPEDIERFLAEPHAIDAVSLRRWDDQAKIAGRATPGWDHFQRVLERAALQRSPRQPAVAA